MKYIEADKLIAEIDSRMEDCKLPDGKFPTTTNIVRYEELSCLRNFITSLQQEQPEVDLDALVNETFDKYSSVDGYGQLSVSFNRAELYSFIKKLARKEE